MFLINTHFVLFQMPKKYYVHNDIFRYQDDVFPEENSDETAEGTVGKTSIGTLDPASGIL